MTKSKILFIYLQFYIEMSILKSESAGQSVRSFATRSTVIILFCYFLWIVLGNLCYENWDTQQIKEKMFIYVQEYFIACIVILIESTTATHSIHKIIIQTVTTHDMIHNRFSVFIFTSCLDSNYATTAFHWVPCRASTLLYHHSHSIFIWI